MEGAAGTPETPEQAMARVRLVPDSHRDFTEDLASLPRLHRVGAQLLERLLDLGLSCRGAGPSRMFDRLDLRNICIALQLSCPIWAVMRLWGRMLTQVSDSSSVSYRLRFAVDCPEPGHDGDCPLTFAPALLATLPPGGLSRAGRAQFLMDPVLHSAGRLFSEPFTMLIEAAQRMRFHLLPPGLSHDLGFLSETWLADSLLATRFLVEQGREHGIAVRPAGGLFLVKPQAFPHQWVEFGIDGGWHTADPFMLTSLARWGLLDGTLYPPHRSPPAVLWHLFAEWPEGASGHTEGPRLVRHGEVPSRPATVTVMSHAPA